MLCCSSCQLENIYTLVERRIEVAKLFIILQKLSRMVCTSIYSNNCKSSLDLGYNSKRDDINFYDFRNKYNLLVETVYVA